MPFGVSREQLAIAWVLAAEKNIVPVIGARKRTQFQELLAAVEVVLSTEELTRIEAAIPGSEIAGTRYNEHQMKMLDSEQFPAIIRGKLRISANTVRLRKVICAG